MVYILAQPRDRSLDENELIVFRNSAIALTLRLNVLTLRLNVLTLMTKVCW